MAKKSLGNEARRTFGVAVVGLSGTERDKGVTGVGKSCLCNRFIRPHANSYERQHISVLSQSDFGGRVVNNDHFLYWGSQSRVGEDGIEYEFLLIEQTEFIDDSSFQPFRIGKMDPYHKRCAATKLSSAEKLAYICKDQLGLEDQFQHQFMPEGRLNIDGFLCVFDVSMVEQRQSNRQLDVTYYILCNLVKTKRPVVLVTTKNDQAHRPYAREAENLLLRKDLKNYGIPLVETSSHENINVDNAFMLLGQMMDKTLKARPAKPLGYTEAAQMFNEQKAIVTKRFLECLKSTIKDYRISWSAAEKKLAEAPEYYQFLHLFGSRDVRSRYSSHITALKQEKLREKKKEFGEKLATVLTKLFPTLDTVGDRSWPNLCQNHLHYLDEFEDYFVVLPRGQSWDQEVLMERHHLDRIPFDWLHSGDAETIFRNHVNALRAEFRRKEMKVEFRRLLEGTPTICPGKSLSEVTLFLMGRECFSNLTEEERQEVYSEFQTNLQEKAKAEFVELLHEKAEALLPFQQVTFTNNHLDSIKEHLRPEPRYKALRCMPAERNEILLTHIGFIQTPTLDHCPFKDPPCVDNIVNDVLTRKARRPQSWSKSAEFLIEAENNSLNLVILGAQGLALKLQQEMQRFLSSVEDEYLIDGSLYILTIRPISGNVSLPEHNFTTPTFQPHGCLCVYNSLTSLDYLRDSLDKTLIACDSPRGGRRLQGLPVVLVLAHNPQLTEQGQLHTLREHGLELAARFQCRFVDIPSSMMEGRNDLCHADQVGLAMHHLLEAIHDRSSLVHQWPIFESIEPDIRLLMCLMCGDPYKLELPLAPLLNHQCCYLTVDRLPTVNLETYLGDSKKKLEITVCSYHQATQVLDELYHGYIMVYSVQRKASLANLRAYGKLLPASVPKKILAVTEGGASDTFFNNEFSQSMLSEGNTAADNLGASFMTTCLNFSTQTASYSPFFKECWEKKEITENEFSFAPDDSIENALPFPSDQFGTFGKHSTGSNPNMENEPIYDRPLIYSPSDSDQDSLPRPNQANPYASVSLLTNGHTSGDNVSHHSPHSSAEPTPPTTLQKSSAMSSRREKDGHRFASPARDSSKRAPLAQIEIDGEYGVVKDALMLQPESDYAEVVDCLPKWQIQRIRTSQEHAEDSGFALTSATDAEKTMDGMNSDTLDSNASKASDEDGGEQSSFLSKFSSFFTTSEGKKKKTKGKNNNLKERQSDNGLELQPEGLILQQVMMFIQFIEARGLLLEGVYRISGNKAMADQVLQHVREDDQWDLLSSEYPVTAVTTALKQLVVDLPQPLITPGLKDSIKAAMSLPVGLMRLEHLKNTLVKLPENHRKILQCLAVHLHNVAEYADRNRMTSGNLSKCWWPTMTQCDYATMDDFANEANYWDMFVQTLIEYPHDLLS